MTHLRITTPPSEDASVQYSEFLPDQAQGVHKGLAELGLGALVVQVIEQEAQDLVQLLLGHIR